MTLEKDDDGNKFMELSVKQTGYSINPKTFKYHIKPEINYLAVFKLSLDDAKKL